MCFLQCQIVGICHPVLALQCSWYTSPNASVMSPSICDVISVIVFSLLSSFKLFFLIYRLCWLCRRLFVFLVVIHPGSRKHILVTQKLYWIKEFQLLIHRVLIKLQTVSRTFGSYGSLHMLQKEVSVWSTWLWGWIAEKIIFVMLS